MHRLSAALDKTAFVISTNRRRLLLVFALIAIAVAMVGAAAVGQGIVGLIGTLPQMAVSLTFAAAYIIFQFGILFWFLSRPRKYTVTPDDQQIAMRFARRARMRAR